MSAPATTIDEVILQLTALVEDAATTHSRLGYFAALYNRVTMAVRDAMRAGRFDDNARMERLDVAFANRYLDAYNQMRAGHRPTLSWHVAFDAAGHADLNVLQHLVLGMNAHINLDLGIAAAGVAPGASIHALAADFARINDVLASLVPTVDAQLREISPDLNAVSSIGDLLGNLDDALGNFSIEEARDGAWRFAVRLAYIDSPLLRELAIGARDAVVAGIGAPFCLPGPLADLLGGQDGSQVEANVRILARDEQDTTPD